MRQRIEASLSVALLLLAAAGSMLWVRSYYKSDWIARIHRIRPGDCTAQGVGTLPGIAGFYCARNQRADYGDASDTVWQYNVQSIPPSMSPLLRTGQSAFGFGWLFEREKTRWYAQGTAPLWFVSLIPAACAMPLLRRVRRARRAREGLCPQCGYDLRATPDRCPECGIAAKPA